MVGKLAAISIAGLVFCSCSNRFKYYRDFSFMVNDVVALDTNLVRGNEFQERTVGNLDSCFTYVGTLSTTYDIRYLLGFCSDSLFILHGRDTLLLQNMLGPDSIWVKCFNLKDFRHAEVYRLQNRLSNDRCLYLSFGHENVGNAPGSWINFVFPLSENDQIEGGFAYMTNHSDFGPEPCLDCFTDCNRDGKTDFIRWIYGGDNKPVEYLNFSKNGQRTYHHTRYKSIYMNHGMSWGFVHNGYLGNRNR